MTNVHDVYAIMFFMYSGRLYRLSPFFFFLHVAFTEKKSQMSGCYMLKTQLLYAAPSMAAFRNKQEGSVYIVFLHT